MSTSTGIAAFQLQCGQCSSILPYKSTLTSIEYDEEDVCLHFNRGSREWKSWHPLFRLPHLYYACVLGDDELRKALERNALHQAVSQLEPAFSAIERPGHSLRSLNAFNMTHNLDVDAVLADDPSEYSFMTNLKRLVEVFYPNYFRLPLHNWSELEVLQVITDCCYTVRQGARAYRVSQNEIFGCILFKAKELPAAEAYHSYLCQLERLSEAVYGKGKHSKLHSRTPLLTGLIRLDDYTHKVVGFLYGWTVSSEKDRSMSHLTPDDLEHGQRLQLYEQCEDLMQQFWKLGFSVVAKDHADEILSVMGVSSSLVPFVRLPQLGAIEKVPVVDTSSPIDGPQQEFVFNENSNDDKAALERLWSFLMGESTSSQSISSQRPRAPDSGYKGFSKLPPELICRIFDYSLSRPSVHWTETGFHSSPPLDTALFATCRYLQELALDRFFKNRFVVEYNFLGTFFEKVEKGHLLYGFADHGPQQHNSNSYASRVGVNKWTSIEQITLLVQDDGDHDDDYWGHQRHPGAPSWERSGAALGKLLSGQRMGEAKLKSVQIVFIRRVTESVQEIRLIKSFGHFYDPVLVKFYCAKFKFEASVSDQSDDGASGNVSQNGPEDILQKAVLEDISENMLAEIRMIITVAQGGTGAGTQG